MTKSGCARVRVILRRGAREAVHRSTIRRLFLMWLGVIALAAAGEITHRTLLLVSGAYAAFVIVYYASVVAPEVVSARVWPLSWMMPLLDWMGRALVYRWTRSLVAFVLLLVLIAEEPSVRNLFFAAFIALLLVPERAHDEETWHVSGSFAAEAGREPALTIDGDEATFWSSADNQVKGMSLDLGLGRPRYFNGLSIYYGGQLAQSPRGYELYALRSGAKPEPVKLRCRDAKSPSGHGAHRLRFGWVRADGLRLVISVPREGVKWVVAELVPHFTWRNRHDLAVAFLAMLAVLGFLAYHFYVAPATHNRRQLTYGAMVHGAPDFSPDGRTLVHDTDDAKEGYNRLHLLDLVTGTDGDVRALGDGRHWHASFCSTSDRLVFSSTLGDPRRGKNSHIYELDLTLGEFRQITIGEDRRADWPHCSPDGSWVVYSALDANGRHQLFLADVVAGESTLPEPITMLDGDAIHPRFSPDGERIVFAGRQITDKAWTLYLISRTASGWSPPSRVFPATSDSFHPDFAPDGESLVFTRRECGAYSLYQVNLDNGSLFWLGYLWDSDGTFSSDGKTIAFSSARGGNWQVYTMPVSDRANSQYPTDRLIKSAHLLLLEFNSRLQAASVFRPDPLMGY